MLVWTCAVLRALASGAPHAGSRSLDVKFLDDGSSGRIVNAGKASHHRKGAESDERRNRSLLPMAAQIEEIRGELESAEGCAHHPSLTDVAQTFHEEGKHRPEE